MKSLESEEDIPYVPGTDEAMTEGTATENSESEGNAEIDFMKPTPKNMIPKMKIQKIKRRKKACCSSDEDGDDDDTEPRKLRKGKKVKKDNDENLTTKRLVALFMLFPMIITALVWGYDALGKFKFEKSAVQATAAIGGAGIALFIMSKVAILQSAVKFILCFAWIVLLIPTYQVYSCSPIEMKNDMLGTWFSLKTSASKFLENSHVTSLCFRSSKFPTPYMLSLMSPKISLTVDISQLINLNTENEIPDEDASRSLNYFLIVSKRSVKKKFHKLHLIVEAAPKLADTLKKALKLSSTEKDKNLLLISGSIYDLDEPLAPMKKELESMNYLIRPIKLKVHAVKYIDRYVKLKNTVNENMY